MQRARDAKADFILAVGGGSVCDYSKAVSISVNCKEDPWEKYFIRFEDVDKDCKIIPVGCVLTMVGTGSEMNGGSVITNHAQKLKIGHVFGENVFPKFSVLDPEFTFTLPRYQMTAGFFDIMSHIMEQYFSGGDDNTSDYIAEGLMRSLVRSSEIAVKNPLDYEGSLQHNVDGHVGAQHAHRQGQVHRLGGAHDRPGRRRAYRCHSRHDPLGGINGILPPHNALRTQKFVRFATNAGA